MCLMRAASCSGLSATTIWMVLQLGLAMMPFGPLDGGVHVHLGHHQRTPASMRHALELSMTTAPARAANGANSRETLAPALKSAMSTPANESGPSFSIVTSLPAKRRLRAGRSRRSQGDDALDRKLAGLQGPQHLTAYSAGGSCDGNDERHALLLVTTRLKSERRGSSRKAYARKDLRATLEARLLGRAVENGPRREAKQVCYARKNARTVAPGDVCGSRFARVFGLRHERWPPSGASEWVCGARALARHQNGATR